MLVSESVLNVQFVGPVDDQLQADPDSSFWGVVLQREEDSTFIPVGNNCTFLKYFKNLKYDPVQMLVSAVSGSYNGLAAMLLDQVRAEQERFMVNGEWFNWEDLQGARGDLGSEEDEDDDFLI